MPNSMNIKGSSYHLSGDMGIKWLGNINIINPLKKEQMIVIIDLRTIIFILQL